MPARPAARACRARPARPARPPRPARPGRAGCPARSCSPAPAWRPSRPRVQRAPGSRLLVGLGLLGEPDTQLGEAHLERVTRYAQVMAHGPEIAVELAHAVLYFLAGNIPRL